MRSGKKMDDIFTHADVSLQEDSSLLQSRTRPQTQTGFADQRHTLPSEGFDKETSIDETNIIQSYGLAYQQKAQVKMRPMAQFKVLSHKFDEEGQIGPSKIDRVKTIYQRYDAQLKKLDKLGVDKTKKETIEMDLSELLSQTQNMNSVKAKQHYDSFVKDTE